MDKTFQMFMCGLCGIICKIQLMFTLWHAIIQLIHCLFQNIFRNLDITMITIWWFCFCGNPL